MAEMEAIAIKNGKTYTVKKWIVYLNFAIMLATVIGFVIKTIAEPIIWKTDIENKVEKVETKVNDHIINTDIHPTYEKRSQQFVPRTELEKRMDDMNKKLDMILNARYRQ